MSVMVPEGEDPQIRATASSVIELGTDSLIRGIPMPILAMAMLGSVDGVCPRVKVSHELHHQAMRVHSAN